MIGICVIYDWMKIILLKYVLLVKTTNNNEINLNIKIKYEKYNFTDKKQIISIK